MEEQRVEKKGKAVAVKVIKAGPPAGQRASTLSLDFLAPQDRVPPPGTPLDDASLYFNRELTWLSFNQRVLCEAEDERTPLMERMKFVAIVSNNLDEFFMKRIGGLKQQLGAGVTKLTLDGHTPLQQIEACYRYVAVIEKRVNALLPLLLEQLKQEGMEIVFYSQLNDAEKKYLREFYLENIFPLVTPQTIDPAHPFPFISNLSLNLLVMLETSGYGQGRMARVKVPIGAGISRFVRLEGSNRLAMLEEVMSNNLDLLFPEVTIRSCDYFRVTRNANTEKDEEQADDLLALIETELRERKFAPIVRIKVSPGMNTVHRAMLAAQLGLNEGVDVFEAENMLALRDLFLLPRCSDGRPDLCDGPHYPVDHPLLSGSATLFERIREAGPFLLHHPYVSFGSSVERFLKEASTDPNVRAIKMTLYRTSEDTKVVDYLVEASYNGKQVTVAVELKARFDEEANIKWATRMEEAGIHVTYGVVGLKTHSKIILVVRQENIPHRICRYAHIGTGNYHAGTARMYCDLGILTNDEAICKDLTELFNFLTTGCTAKRNYQKILPSPKILKDALLVKIEREKKLHSAKNPGLIQLKMNALEDADITRALYGASQAGVKIDLIVRDSCRMRPGIPGLSENVTVISIVGRFLEHTRIYYFRNGGDEEYFIGSADLMKRNLESRVEVVTPVEGTELRKELRMILDTQLGDQRSAWELQTDGSYVQRMPVDDSTQKSCQETFIVRYKKYRKDNQFRSTIKPKTKKKR